MKPLFDIIPVIIFFVVYKIAGIYMATWVTMVVAILQIGGYWLMHREFSKLHFISTASILLLGGLTLIFHNPTFIKWKPTLVYWGMGLSLGGHYLLNRQSFIKRLLSDKMVLPERIWNQVTLIVCVFFVLLGVVNLLVAYQLSTDAWVTFKLITAGIIFIFFMLLAFYVSRHMQPS